MLRPSPKPHPSTSPVSTTVTIPRRLPSSAWAAPRPACQLRAPLLVRDSPPTSTSAPTAPKTTPQDPTTQCIATGDSVVCEITAATPAPPPTPIHTLESAQCVAAGDSVICELPPPNPSLETPPPAATSLRDAALLVFPFFAWGTSMPALKLVMPHIPSPLLLGSLRLLPASLILVAWAAGTGRKHPDTLQAWAWIGLFSLVDGAAFQGFLAEGLTRTSAGLGSVIIDSQPLTVALLAAALFGERLGPTAVAGLVLGVVGLLLVEVPQEAWAGLFDGALGTALQSYELAAGAAAAEPAGSWWAALGRSGEFWMLLAAQSMAVGTVMVRYVTRHADSVYATGYHMLFGGLMLLGAVALQEPDVMQQSWEACTASDLAILAYISVLGGAASYGIFFYNASVKGNLTALSSLTFLTPLFAVAGGYLVLQETLTPLQVCGAAVTLAAVYLITHRAPASE